MMRVRSFRAFSRTYTLIYFFFFNGMALLKGQCWEMIRNGMTELGWHAAKGHRYNLNPGQLHHFRQSLCTWLSQLSYWGTLNLQSLCCVPINIILSYNCCISTYFRSNIHVMYMGWLAYSSSFYLSSLWSASRLSCQLLWLPLCG